MILGKSIKQSLQLSGRHKTLLRLAEAAGVDLDVSNCTVFAPSDAAFERTRPGYIDSLLADPQAAAAVILRHVLPGRVLTSKQIKGCGFWEDVAGGPLGYEGLGSIVRIGNAMLDYGVIDDECDNGIIHTITAVLDTPAVKPPSVRSSYFPSIAASAFDGSTVGAVYPTGQPGRKQRRSLEACLPSTTGGRKAMGLMTQLPFWMYGPPFNAAKQVEYEPISAVDMSAGVDYQVMPPGSVVVVPDEVSAAKLLPVSGMSRYIGKTQRLVEGDGESDYSKLPY